MYGGSYYESKDEFMFKFLKSLAFVVVRYFV